MVQACVRRWLAKLKYKRNRVEAARSAVTLQRHIRGWLTRRKVHALREQAKMQKALVEQARIKREQEQRMIMEKLGRLEDSLTLSVTPDSSSFLVAVEKMKKAMAKAKMPKKTTSREDAKFEDKVNIWRNKENVNVEKAASIIQNRKFERFFLCFYFLCSVCLRP